MKTILMLSILFISIFARDIKPDYSFKASGGVTEMVLIGDTLYASTDASCVNVYDIKEKKKIKDICVSKIKDFMGDEIDSKIYSIDVLDGALLILSQDGGGYRRVDIVKDGKLNHIITKNDRLYISRAKFINNHTILIGLLSNIIMSYDIDKKTTNWDIQPTESKFSYFTLNEDKTKAATTDESGDVQMLDLVTGKVIKTFSGLNVDNVFQVDWKKDTIATAGQDRRCVVFNAKTKKGYYKQATFLIYSVGVSNDGNLVGFASDEQNNVTIFNAFTKADIAKLLDNKANISNILFVNNHEVFVSSDAFDINHYKF